MVDIRNPFLLQFPLPSPWGTPVSSKRIPKCSGQNGRRLYTICILFRLQIPKPVRLVMSLQEVQTMFLVLRPRERLVAKLAVIAGMRPGEIFGLTWGRLTATYAD